MPREFRSGASGAADVDESVYVDDEEATASKGTVYFYSTQNVFGFLSNFSRHPILIGGHTWQTVEHYFQAQKFAGTEHVGAILRAASPTVAARMGRSRQLLETGDARIVEHTTRDRYWADGGDGSGRNMLGRLLMRVRDELR
jgi:N-glycosidase YbiA